MSVRTYNPSVRVGNWNEEIQLEEDRLKDFMAKRDKGLLMIQDHPSLVDIFSDKRDLSITRDGYVHYGDVVSIFCEQAKDGVVMFQNMEHRVDCMLAIDLSDEAKSSKKFTSPLPMTVTKQCKSVVRTSFVITSLDGSPDGATLNYGQPFQIQPLDKVGTFYLHSNKKTFLESTRKSQHQLLQLVDRSSFLTHWQILHRNPQLRLEFEFAPVPANQPLVINHCKTNRNIALEENAIVRNEFGYEFEASAHTYLDTHRSEMDINVWRLVMNEPGDYERPVDVGSTTATPAKAQETPAKALDTPAKSQDTSAPAKSQDTSAPAKSQDTSAPEKSQDPSAPAKSQDTCAPDSTK